jgi:hypothetical protein
MKQKRSKYGAKKVDIDGIKFDSKKEGKRYRQLLLLLHSGEISDLKLQVGYTFLINGEYLVLRSERYNKGGRKIRYVADFTYTETATGELVVEDVKGMVTRDAAIKIALMSAVNGVVVRVV